VNFFYVWGVDFIGPLSSLLGFIYILLVVDYVLKWVETKATLTNDSNIVFKKLKLYLKHYYIKYYLILFLFLNKIIAFFYNISNHFINY